jgi:hypothetical protein
VKTPNHTRLHNPVLSHVHRQFVKSEVNVVGHWSH